MQEYWNAVAHSKAALYRGDVESAAAGLEAKWQPFNRSLFTRLPLLRSEGSILQGGIALARAAEAKARGDGEALRARLREARHHTRILERIGIPSGTTAALVHRAGIAHVEGAADECIRWLRAAVTAFEISGGVLYYACSWRLGQLLGGSEGDALIAEGRRWFEEQSVREPASMLAMQLPGWA
jgi:hypothetical protein